MMKSRLETALLVDEHDLYRTALAQLIKGQLDFKEVVESDQYPWALSWLGGNDHVALMVLTLDLVAANGGSEAVCDIRRLCPELSIVVTSDGARRDEVLDLLAAGVRGFLPRGLRAAGVVEALRTVRAGQVFLPRGLLDGGAGANREPVLVPGRAAVPAGLTARQQQVVRLIAAGKSNKEIARALRLAEGTIKVHVNALYRTLSVRNRASAVAALAQNGWRQAS